MIDPYRMVVVNSVLGLVLILGTIFYHFVYPRRKINLVFLLLLISLLPVVSILRKGTYEAGTLTEHVQIAISFYQTLQDKNLIPLWSGASLAGYGSPVHLFLYPLPYYLIASIHLLGLSFLASVKLLLALSFVGSGMTMYLWINEERGKLPAFVAALFYLFAPYHLIELHFRAAIGVTLSFVFLPLCMLFIVKTMKKGEITNCLLGGISLALLILSHHAVFIACAPFIFLYAFLLYFTYIKSIKNLLLCCISFVLGMLLTAFYWLPLLVEGKLIQGFQHLQTSDFLSIKELLFSPTLLGFLFQGHHGETHFLIGYPHLLVLGTSVVLLLKNNMTGVSKKLLIFLTTFSFIYIFLTHPFSRPLWQLPLMHYIPTSWRLLAPISLLTSAVASVLVAIIVNKKESFFVLPKKRGNKATQLTDKSSSTRIKNVLPEYVVAHEKQIFIIFICVFTIFSTILNWGNRRTVPLNYDKIKQDWTRLPAPDEKIWTIWVDPNARWIHSIPTTHIEILRGNAKILPLSRISTRPEYLIEVISPTSFKENTLYFPGWKVYVNNHDYPFQFNTPPFSGLIAFSLPPGLYKVDVTLQNLFTRAVSQLISLVAILVVFCLYTYCSYREKNECYH
ncbi:hypothetical protein BH11PAT1_BH11PAT1_1380 [soil metagenome]